MHIINCTHLIKTLGALGIAALFSVPGAPAPAQEATQPVAIDVPAPKLTGEAKDWINTGGKPLAFKKGTVYVVHFWTFG